MIRIISSKDEVENNFEEKVISHPLWHGLKVVVIPDQKKSLFNCRAYIPIGHQQYVPSSNRDFYTVWNAFLTSGKTIQAFQASLFKNVQTKARKETLLAAALSLAEDEGYADKQLVVQRGWQDVANQIAVIFPRTFKKIGKGGFGVIREADGFMVNTDFNSIEKTKFALKEAIYKEDSTLLEQGMTLLKKIWGPGLVRPSHHLLIPNGRMEALEEWAMPIYTADLGSWSKKSRDDPKKIITAFLSSFKGLDILLKNRVAHLDLKPQNLLVFEDNDHLFVDINDFDGCFVLPTTLDAESIQQFEKDLEGFCLLHTPHYCRKEEIKALKTHLASLKELFKTNETERDEEWFKDFSVKLEEAALLLYQMQIYEWGWCLVGALTGKSPYFCLPTDKDTKTKIEPNKEKIETALEGLDEAVKTALIQVLDPDPALRPTANVFKDALVEYLEKSAASYDHVNGNSHDPLSTKPILGKSSSRRVVATLPTRACQLSRTRTKN